MLIYACKTADAFVLIFSDTNESIALFADERVCVPESASAPAHSGSVSEGARCEGVCVYFLRVGGRALPFSHSFENTETRWRRRLRVWAVWGVCACCACVGASACAVEGGKPRQAACEAMKKDASGTHCQ